MYTLIVITSTYGLIFSVYRYIEFDVTEVFDSNYQLMSIILSTARCIKFLGDLYLHIVFIIVFKFLL